MEQLFPGVYRDGMLYTENGAPGQQVYGERLKTADGTEYRAWDAHRSKAAAAITKGLQDFPVEQDDAVLYLGASTGTTPSHIADIVAQGIVYAVEYSPKVIRSLLSVAEKRTNLAPILGNARTPQEYEPLCSRVDVVYQDVAQRDQIAILKRNADTFLKEDGHALLTIKAQSISSSRAPEEVFDEAKEQLEEDFDILHGVKLEPFHTDHLFLVLNNPG